MRLSTEWEIRLCRCSLKRTMSRMKRMRCNPSFGVRYCSLMAMANPLFDAGVPVEQVWKGSSWPRQR